MSAAHKPKIKPFASARSHKLIVFLILFVAFVAAALYYSFKGPTFQTAAVIEVLPKYVTNLDTGNELQIRVYRDFAQNQVYTLTSYELMLDAINILNPNPTGGMNKKEMAHSFLSALEVVYIRNTYRISVSVSGGQPGGLAELVNAVIEAYIEKVNDDKLLDKDVRVENLNKRKAELTSELHALVSRKTSLVEKMGIIAFEDSVDNPYDSALLDASNALNEAKGLRIEAQTQLSSISRSTNTINEVALQVEVERELNENSYLIALREALSEKKIGLLSSIAGTSQTHPGRKATERQIEEIEKEFQRVKDNIKQEVSEKLKKKLEIEKQFRKEQLENDLEVAINREKTLEQEFKSQKDNVSQHAMLYNTALNLHSKIEQNRSQLAKIEDRLNFFKTEESSPGFVRISSRARTPEDPVKGKKLKIVLLLLAGGLFMSILVPTAIDYMNPLLKTPNEIDAILKFPSMGWVIEDESETTHHFRLDQIRRLAMSIDNIKQKEGYKFFVFTSVKPGGGTTSITLDLANAFRNLGINVMTIECNAFKPDERFEKLADYDLTLFTKGKTEVEDLKPHHYLKIGDVHGNKMIDFKHDFFQNLEKTGHDIYLLDAPPILLSSDTEFMSRHSDATILIVEADGVISGEVSRASFLLQKIKPKSVGSIANRIRVNKGTGYFSKMLAEFETGEKYSKLLLSKNRKSKKKENKKAKA